MVIHASKSQRYKDGDYSRLLPGLLRWEQLDFGALVGVVEVVGCVPLAEVADDPFAVGPWCWILRPIRPIQPVSYQGRVGSFEVPDHLLQPVKRLGRILTT